jgi:hypothetical protein
MRRLAIVFLLALIPLQLAWAEANTYCTYEEDQPTHICHHVDQRAHINIDDEDKDRQSDSWNTTDKPHCQHHHGESTQIMSLLSQSLDGTSTQDFAPGTAPFSKIPPLARIDRPKWSVLA